MPCSILYCCVYAAVWPSMDVLETLYAIIICIILPSFPMIFCQAHLPRESEPDAITLPPTVPKVVRRAPPGR